MSGEWGRVCVVPALSFQRPLRPPPEWTHRVCLLCRPASIQGGLQRRYVARFDSPIDRPLPRFLVTVVEHLQSRGKAVARQNPPRE